jgi:hypothetical protein
MMSDKPYSHLSLVAQRLERAYPPTMDDMTQVIVERRVGFELFNTRPYHNYETWSTGWYAKDAWGNRACTEDLDDCLNKLCAQREAQKKEG